MDKTDRRILEYLLQDARTSFSEIATHLGLSVDTVSKRYSKMKKSHVIKCTTLFLDVSKSGTGLMACLNITAGTGHRSEIEERLRDTREVFLIGKTFGAYDFFALATVNDIDSLDELRDRISGIQDVKSCDVSILTTGLSLISPNQLPVVTKVA